MIRLHIERFTIEDKEPRNGLTWWVDGDNVGRVVIEEWNEFLNPFEENFVPVEVIDES